MTRNWAEILAKPMPESPTAAQMLSYVKGYIMALEDILRDIEQWYMDGNRDSEWYEGLDAVRFSVQESLREARQTLERLQ